MKSIITLILTSLMLTSCGDIFGPSGPGADCLPGSTNNVNKISNNLHEFHVTGDQCMKYDEGIEKKELPLIVDQPLPAGLSISPTAKITNSIWWETYAFDITNTSGNTYCDVKFTSLGAIDAAGNDVASEEVEYLEGVIVSSTYSYDDCILDGQTLTVAGTMTLKAEDISSASSFFISEVSADSSNSDTLNQVQINPISMDWNDDVINFHLINNSLKDIEISGGFMKAKYFDAQGYYVDLDFIEPSIQSKFVNAGEQFIVNSTYYHTADNARKVQISIDWSEQ